MSTFKGFWLLPWITFTVLMSPVIPEDEMIFRVDPLGK